MTIEIQQEEQGDFRVLVLSGRLDTETSADLELALSDLQAAGASNFVIDLTNIGYVSSAGLRVLLATAKQLDGGRGVLRLCCLNGTVQEVFDVAGFSRMFAIFPTREAALGAPPPGGAKPAAVSKSADSALAKQVAALLGAGESNAPPSADSADLARSAAQLLGAGAKPARDAESKPAPPSKASPPPATAPSPPPASESPGVLGKFRNLFGKK